MTLVFIRPDTHPWDAPLTVCPSKKASMMQELMIATMIHHGGGEIPPFVDVLGVYTHFLNYDRENALFDHVFQFFSAGCS